MITISSKKRFKRIIVVLICLGIAIPPIVLLVKKFFYTSSEQLHQLFTPKEVVCTINDIFNQELYETIKTFVTQRTTQQSLLGFDHENFYHDLKKKFPIIKEIDLQFQAPQTLYLTIKGTLPYCIVNDTFVLGNKCRLFSKELFSTANINQLPSIQINERWIKASNKLNKNVYIFVHKIPANIWQQHHIVYNAPWHIQLTPKTVMCRCHILTDEKNLFNQRKFAMLGSLFQDICNKDYLTKNVLAKKKIPLAFDFRIKNQIIVKFYESVRRGKGL